jgi:hypothetical protein
MRKLFFIFFTIALPCDAQTLVGRNYEGLQIGGGDATRRLPAQNLLALYPMVFTPGSPTVVKDASGHGNDCTMSGVYPTPTMSDATTLGFVPDTWGLMFANKNGVASCPASVISGQTAVSLYWTVRTGFASVNWQDVWCEGPTQGTSYTSTTPFACFVANHGNAFGLPNAGRPAFVVQNSSGSTCALEFPANMSQTGFQQYGIIWTATGITGYVSSVAGISSVSTSCSIGPANISAAAQYLGHSPFSGDPGFFGTLGAFAPYGGADSLSVATSKMTVMAKAQIARVNAVPTLQPAVVSNTNGVITPSTMPSTSVITYIEYALQTDDNQYCVVFTSWPNLTSGASNWGACTPDPTFAGLSSVTPVQLLAPSTGFESQYVLNPFVSRGDDGHFRITYVGGSGTGKFETPPSCWASARADAAGFTAAALLGTYTKNAGNPLQCLNSGENWKAQQQYGGRPLKWGSTYYALLDGASANIATCTNALLGWFEQTGYFTASSIDGPYTEGPNQPFMTVGQTAAPNTTAGNCARYDGARNAAYWLITNPDGSPKVTPYGYLQGVNFDVSGGDTSTTHLYGEPKGYWIGKDPTQYYELDDSNVNPMVIYALGSYSGDLSMINLCKPGSSTNIFAVEANCWWTGMMSGSSINTSLGLIPIR